MSVGKPDPFPYSDSNKRYHTYDFFLRRRFGRKCARITLDAGFSCPNIDGTCGKGGCIYCSFPLETGRRTAPLAEQFAERRAVESAKWPRSASIVYFNTGTNTYAPVEKLRAVFEEAIGFPDVVGLAVATRADSVSDEALELLRELSERTFLVVELGLQTVHDKTAGFINRGHDYAAFLKAYERLRGLNLCVHVINGLPGETREMMADTAKELARLHPMMVKIHMLYVTRGTPLAALWERGGFRLLEKREYAEITADQLELLPADVVIGRLTGDGERSSLLAPEWTLKKLTVLNEIDKVLASRGSFQGSRYKEQ